jgi:hypothetical protein
MGQESHAERTQDDEKGGGTMRKLLRPMDALKVWSMKICATRNYTSCRRRLFFICDWMGNSMLFLLPLFFAMFCLVLFCIWYFNNLNLWLVGMGSLLVLSMSAVAVMFGIGAIEMGAPGDRAGTNSRSSI